MSKFLEFNGTISGEVFLVDIEKIVCVKKNTEDTTRLIVPAHGTTSSDGGMAHITVGETYSDVKKRLSKMGLAI